MFDIGTALNRTFKPVFQNPVTFLGIGALITAISIGLSLLVSGGAMVSGDLTSGVGPAFGITTFLAVLVSVVLNAVALGALITAAIGAYRGRKVGIGEALSSAVPHIVPLILINILLTIGVVFGMVLLIIPGIFLAVKWAASLPTRVEESTGVFESFKRSWALTKGAWWPIFGFLVLLVIGSIILSFAVMAPLGIAGASGATGTGVTATVVIVQMIISTLQIVFTGTAMAAIYYGLRTAKEGGDTAALSETFA